MKRKISFIITILLLCNVTFAQRVIKQYYPDCDTCIFIETPRNNEDQIHGKWKSYYKSGQLEMEMVYANDSLREWIKVYYENGQTKYHLTFAYDNIKKGSVRFYHPNGNLMCYGKFNNFEIRIIQYDGDMASFNHKVFLAEKIGLWLYFNDDLTLRGVEEFNNNFIKVQVENLRNPYSFSW